MEKIRPFQIGLLVGFALIALLSLFVMASYRNIIGADVNPYGSRVLIWGVLDSRAIGSALTEIRDDDKDFAVVSYVEKDPRTFEEELLNAIAENRAPDAILFSHEDLVTHRSKILPIPYETISKRMIRDIYTDGASIFALSDGFYALPFVVDPMVMYWNRDILSSSGQAEPPTTWESLTDMVQEVTLRDATRNILLSAIAFGEYDNVVNAKGVILTLTLQAGSRMIEETEDSYLVGIDESLIDNTRRPLGAALQFYIEFSNINSPLYSWNRSQADDISAFVAEDLALYFGYASEFNRMSDLNPNFNFDLSPVPQGSGATIKQLYGNFYGFGVLRDSPNPQGTYRALLKLSDANSANYVAGNLTMAPVHRAALVQDSADPYIEVINKQALISRGWLDPNAPKSDVIFSEMVNDVVSNNLKIFESADDAADKLELEF